MRNPECKRSCRSTSAPVFTFDTDARFDHVSRDPMTVLLGRSSLSVQHNVVDTDPYNRVGRLVRVR